MKRSRIGETHSRTSTPSSFGPFCVLFPVISVADFSKINDVNSTSVILIYVIKGVCEEEKGEGPRETDKASFVAYFADQLFWRIINGNIAEELVTQRPIQKNSKGV